jgi:hypothetical protein
MNSTDRLWNLSARIASPEVRLWLLALLCCAPRAVGLRARARSRSCRGLVTGLVTEDDVMAPLPSWEMTSPSQSRLSLRAARRTTCGGEKRDVNTRTWGKRFWHFVPAQRSCVWYQGEYSSRNSFVTTCPSKLSQVCSQGKSSARRTFSSFPRKCHLAHKVHQVDAEEGTTKGGLDAGGQKWFRRERSFHKQRTRHHRRGRCGHRKAGQTMMT